jgi:hypothetical protein
MEGEDELSQIVVCAAFPDGIPDEIAYGTVMHNEPYANDHGIQYEKAQED